MKIVYLVQQFPPEVGAGPARVGEMVLRWVAAGAQVTVITGMPNRPQGRIHPEYRGKLFVDEEWNGVRVLRSWLFASPKHGFSRTILNNVSFMVTGAAQALRTERPDVMIASAPPFFVHLAGDAASRWWKTPLVLEVRDLWPDYLVGMGVLKGRRSAGALFRLERYLLARAARVVVVTESFQERIEQKGVPGDRIDVIPNAVDTELYYASDEPPPLAELQRSAGELIVGYLGNFGAGQGLEVVLEAAARMADSAPHVRFVLAGDGTQKQQVIRQADALRLANLTILPPLPKERTRAFYNACDICLVPLAPFPILQETIPSKIFEVMACERPVLASVGGEAARIVQNSRSGLVAEPGDVDGLVAGIHAIEAMSASERAALGARGRAYVSQHFNRTLLADRYLELLRSVADRGRSQSADPVDLAAAPVGPRVASR